MKRKIKALLKKYKILSHYEKSKQKLRCLFKKPISGFNNVVTNNGVLNNVKYDIIGNDNVIEIMKGAVLSNVTIYIRGNNHRLLIEKNCRYNGGSIWFEDSYCQIKIGQKTTIESAHLAATEHYSKISIGDDCMFSFDIELRTGDSHTIIDNITKKRINPAKDIVIGDHVWVGAHAIILKGVTIGNNSIIGINSLVAKNVPCNCIAAGVPAKNIKDNVDWRRERMYG